MRKVVGKKIYQVGVVKQHGDFLTADWRRRTEISCRKSVEN
jgi:hypothetical protein